MKNLCKLNPEDTILTALNKMSDAGKHGSVIPSLAFVESDGVLIGSVSDGDIRKLIGSNEHEHPLSMKVEDVMNANPVTVLEKDMHADGINLDGIDRNISGVFIIDDNGRFVDVVEVGTQTVVPVKEFADEAKKNVFVIGLGFVGLTLALHTAKHGYHTYGVDSDQRHIDVISRGDVPFYEHGLKELLADQFDSRFFPITPSDMTPQATDKTKGNIFILAVGTPIKSGKPCFFQLTSACESLSQAMNKGDLVLLRSTVKAGASKDVIIPMLEEKTGFKCGIDFFYAMAPERTIEGRALHELDTLPQIVGANDQLSLEAASAFFNQIAPQVITVDSTTEAEFSKLLCNSFRDLTFAFSNEFASIVEADGIDASAIIEKCNLGYPRGNLPIPSPGVGGYCLTKDPFLYSTSLKDFARDDVKTLSELGRHKNEIATLAPVRAIENFSDQYNVSMSDMHILIVGVAFKGRPATDDARFSTSIDVMNALNGHIKTLSWIDFAISDLQTDNHLQSIQKMPNTNAVSETIDAIIVMNNHVDNTKLNLTTWLNQDKQKLLFDGWGQFKFLKDKISHHKLTYATMGKRT